MDDLQLGFFFQKMNCFYLGNAAFASLSASTEKLSSGHAGTYAMKLMISPVGFYEVRVNIVDFAEKGYIVLEDSRSLRELVC